MEKIWTKDKIEPHIYIFLCIVRPSFIYLFIFFFFFHFLSYNYDVATAYESFFSSNIQSY